MHASCRAAVSFWSCWVNTIAALACSSAALLVPLVALKVSFAPRSNLNFGGLDAAEVLFERVPAPTPALAPAFQIPSAARCLSAMCRVFQTKLAYRAMDNRVVRVA